MKVALVQLTAKENLNQNLEECYRWIQKAYKDGAEFILLPENFSFLATEKEKLRQAQILEKESEKFLKETAKEFGVYLLGGGYPASTPKKDRVFNQARLVDPKGNTLADYQKIHLFDIAIPSKAEFQESETVEAGKNLIVASVKDFQVGLSICYDLRFPELFQNLRKQGAEVLTIPAAFTYPTGLAHWQTLLQARAIETQCYVLAPAQTGTHSKTRQSYGHSLIIDPWGKILNNADENPNLVMANLDKSFLKTVRSQMPVWNHKKLMT